MTITAGLVTETTVSRAELKANDGSLFRSWQSIARSRGLEPVDDAIGFSHSVAEDTKAGRLALFGDVAAARSAGGDSDVDAARFDYSDPDGRRWQCRIELTDTDIDVRSLRAGQNVSAIQRQVRRLFPAADRADSSAPAARHDRAKTRWPRLSGQLGQIADTELMMRELLLQEYVQALQDRVFLGTGRPARPIRN